MEELNKKLVSAAHDGNTDEVVSCLQRGADINYKGSDDRTALHHAAWYGHDRIVEILVEGGGDVNVQDRLSSTALHWAAEGGRDRIVEILVEGGGDVNVQDNTGLTALHWAAVNGRDRSVEVLVEGGGDVNVQDNEGRTALHWAAGNGHDRIVEILVEGGGEVNARNDWGFTALHYAAYNGHDRIVGILVEGGGKVNARDDEQSTPLHWAVKKKSWHNTEDMKRKERTAAVLAQLGSDMSLIDNQGKTPLDYCTEELKGSLEVLAYQMEIKAAFTRISDVKEFQHLLRKGFYLSYNNRVYLAGACNVGKSTLASILIGVKISKDWVSTDGLKIYFGKNGIDLKKKEMVVISTELQDSNILASVLLGQPSLEQTAEEQQSLEQTAEEQPSLQQTAEEQPSLQQTAKEQPSLQQTAEEQPSLQQTAEQPSLEQTAEEQPSLQQTAEEQSSLDQTDGEQPSLQQTAEERPSLGQTAKEQPSIEQTAEEQSSLEQTAEEQPSLDQTAEEQPSSGQISAVRKKGLLNALKSLFKRRKQKSRQSTPTGISSQKVHVKELPQFSKEEKPSLKFAKHSHSAIHKNLMDKIRSGKYEVSIAPSDLVDFGGQKAFDLTHQLFIQQKGAFVLLIDGRKHLDDVLLEYQDGKMTTRMILLHWVNSILTYCTADNDNVYPLIVFALTHKDELSKEERHMKFNEVTAQLIDMFSGHEYCNRIKFQHLFLINATNNNDSGVLSLKQYLVHVALQQRSWGEKMPMVWVPLELQIDEMRSNDIFIIPFDELFAINKNNDDLSLSDQQFRHFLRCQHSFGKIMHFDIPVLDKYVIVQPAAMVDILRSFITDEFFWPKEPSLHDILNTASSSGIIKKCDLFKLWSQDEFKNYVPTAEIKEYITQVLVHLDILVPPKRFHKPEESLTDTFIIPCMVRQSISSSQLPDNLDNDKTIFLSYRLLKSAIPNALAYKLIGAVLNIWPLKTDDTRTSLYDKAAVLEIDQYNDLYLTFRENRIEVALSNTKHRYKIIPDIASVIQECLALTMTKVLEFYSTSFGQPTSSTGVAKLFVVEVGEKCDNEICYIPLSEVQDKSSWTCNHQHEHSTKYPKYWVFDQKQEMCALDCTGLDKKAFKEVAEDRHLIRLVKLIAQHDFHDFIIHLGLTMAEWEEIKYNYNMPHYDMLTQHFIGLCKWRKKKQARATLPTFKDLAKALSDIKYNNHFLCQIFRERFTEVFAMDNPRLKETPDDSVLQELSRNIGNQTLHLGVELGIDMISIEETQFNFSKDMFDQTYDILIKWKRSGKAQPTVRSLMLALQYVDPRGFQFLQEQYDLLEREPIATKV